MRNAHAHEHKGEDFVRKLGLPDSEWRCVVVGSDLAEGRERKWFLSPTATLHRASCARRG